MWPIINKSVNDKEQIISNKSNSLSNDLPKSISDVAWDTRWDVLLRLFWTKEIIYTMLPFLQPNIDASRTIIDLTQYRDKVRKIAKIKEADDYDLNKTA